MKTTEGLSTFCGAVYSFRSFLKSEDNTDNTDLSQTILIEPGDQ